MKIEFRMKPPRSPGLIVEVWDAESKQFLATISPTPYGLQIASKRLDPTAPLRVMRGSPHVLNVTLQAPRPEEKTS